MKTMTIAFLRCLPVIALSSAASMLAAQENASSERTTSVTLVGGGQLVNDVEERGRARFEEFRDVPEGAVLEFGRLTWTPRGSPLSLSLTAIDALQDDQRYSLRLDDPAHLSLKASFTEGPRFYSSGSKTLWSGVGTGNLTLSETFRQGAEGVAAVPTAPFPAAALQAYMEDALAGASPFDLRTKRKDLKAGLDYRLVKGLTLSLNGRYETRNGTKPFGFGTYIRRQGLSGVPGTGAGFFWRETVEVRGSELVEPVDYKTAEAGASITWTKSGHSFTGGWLGSRFRNDVTSLYFDNPFEAPPGRSSAAFFDPKADQETAAPNGNNNFRGLYSRSVVQLWPDNDYNRLFGAVSVRVTAKTRLNATVARAMLKQDDALLPYAENDQVVFSGAGQPVVLARDAALPRSSLDGKMQTLQADVKLTSRVTDALSVRAAYRHYDLDDKRQEIVFPGFSSSGDSFFRAGIGQKDAAGNRILFNEVGGYSRGRLSAGAAYRLGSVTLDGEYTRTAWTYEARQVDETVDNAVKATVRFAVAGTNVNAFYLRARRDYDGPYAVGLETSGVRAYDVWTRDRDQLGADADLPIGETLSVVAGGSYWKDRYPGAVENFVHGYGLQDSSSGTVYGGLNYAKDKWQLGAWAGYDQYDWNSLQVTKTSQSADYNPINRWTRESGDEVFWVGLEGSVPVGKKGTLRGDVNYQKFSGEWNTRNLETPDVNSAVAYPFPALSDSTLSLRAAFLWTLTAKVRLEARYWYEPYRLDDFTIDGMRPYMQGALQETRSSASDVAPMNASRFLFLDSRYADYTAHVLSSLVHVQF